MIACGVVWVESFPIKSNLESNVDMLMDLALHKPMHMATIMYKAKINPLILKKHLELLAQKNPFEKQGVTKTEITYSTTEEGKKTLKWFLKIKTLRNCSQHPQLSEEV